MITPSSGTTVADYYQAICNGNATHVKLEFENGGGTLTDADIAIDGGVVISSVINSEEDLTYGNAISTEVNVTLLPTSNVLSINWEEVFALSFGVEINNVTDWVCVGYFRGEKPIVSLYSAPRKAIVFKAYDTIKDLDDILADTYISQITFPATVADIFNVFQNVGDGYTFHSGDEIGMLSAMTLDENPFPNGISCRKLLSILAEANGCYARAYNGSKNTIELIEFKPSTSNPTVDENYVFELDISDTTVQSVGSGWYKNTATGLSVIYSFASGDQYKIMNNPIFDGLSAANRTSVLQQLVYRIRVVTGGTLPIQPNPMRYVPSHVNCIGNWLNEAGDIVGINYTDYNGDPQTAYIFVFSRMLSWNGSCVDHYECTGNAKRKKITQADSAKYASGDKVGWTNVANTLTETNDRYVLDARQGKTLSDMIDNKLKIFTFSLPDNATRTFTISGSSTATWLVMTSANYANNRGMWIMNRRGSNASTSADEIKSASNITVTAGVNNDQISVAKSGTYATFIVFICFYCSANTPPTITGS